MLRDYGIHTLGLLAAVPSATIRRLLGGQAGRTATDRARGIDPRPVTPRALPATATVRHTFPQHTLDGDSVRAALLSLVVRLGHLLRRRRQAARALTLTLNFAGNTGFTRTRRLTEPSTHDDDLRLLAYQLMDAAGLQRGRLTALTLKGEDSSTPARPPGRSASIPPAKRAWSPKQPSTASATSSARMSSARPPPTPAPADPVAYRRRRQCQDRVVRTPRVPRRS
ncbi:hypothetical protein [Streptomyces sp. NPDC048002]|uniref:DinB/UmuC family translesion DNA polymerase n=1 Tax=Streptomyces sp. NPDC048002 TaxID=3154344 RepID=UPI0033F3BA8E